jgi:broad specificity phosphatase PhoE
MKIYVIRHAKTLYNEKELINGSLDDDRLSPAGIAQIPELIEAIKEIDFSNIYTSTMTRAIQTAEPIAGYYHASLIEDKRLAEVNLGSFNGQSWESTTPVFGLNSSGLLSGCEYDFTEYGGESASDTKARLTSFITDLKQKSESSPLIICHGGIMRWFYFLSTGKKYGRIPNGTVFKLNI